MTTRVKIATESPSAEGHDSHMTTRVKSATSHATTTSAHEGTDNTMTTQAHTAASPVAPVSTEPASVPAATAPAATATTAQPAPSFIDPPPADAKIPSPPAGFEPTNGADYRGTQPRLSEMVALPQALRDLRKFTNYGLIIGSTAPPLDEVLQTFDVTSQWSVMRKASSAWDQYCRDQEGIAWTVVRAMMERLKPAFDLAVRSNPSIATNYAGLAALLAARTVSANKGAATKKRNKESIAAGEAPTHGQVGKARQKAAEKAALAAQNAKEATNAASVAPSPQVVSAAPVAAAAASPSVVSAAPAPLASAPVATITGTPHS